MKPKDAILKCLAQRPMAVSDVYKLHASCGNLNAFRAAAHNMKKEGLIVQVDERVPTGGMSRTPVPIYASREYVRANSPAFRDPLQALFFGDAR